ncbi:MAG: DsbA family protein [Pseudomonadota bacterium]|nr:DsbA family protein [Pseudomonadota bacterium]
MSFSVRLFSLFLCSVVLSSSMALAAQDSPAAPFNKTQTENIQKLIEQYIQENPEAITNALEKAQEVKDQARVEQARKVLTENYKDITHNPASPVAGNPDGDITVVEYFDYQCGYCKAVAPGIRQLLKDDPQVRFVFKEFPVLGENSRHAAKAALAAHRQGKYQEFHTALMSEKGPVDAEKIRTVARNVGLDVPKLERDMESPDVAAEIDRNRSLAPQMTIMGTPGFIVGNQIISGALPLDDLKKVIADQRARMKQGTGG